MVKRFVFLAVLVLFFGLAACNDTDVYVPKAVCPCDTGGATIAADTCPPCEPDTAWFWVDCDTVPVTDCDRCPPDCTFICDCETDTVYVPTPPDTVVSDRWKWLLRHVAENGVTCRNCHKRGDDWDDV